jgi:hypothetical protein
VDNISLKRGDNAWLHKDPRVIPQDSSVKDSVFTYFMQPHTLPRFGMGVMIVLSMMSEVFAL